MEKLQQRYNSMQECIEAIAKLPKGKGISVIESAQYIYLEDEGQFVRSWERLVYEGPAEDFK